MDANISSPVHASWCVPAVKIPTHDITGCWGPYRNLRVSVLRTDLVDPHLSGNKYFKLKYNLQAAAQQGHKRLLSFGGPWSSHLHALAAAGQRYGLATTGVVRGEAPPELNACLRDAADMGMQLHFVSRQDYRQKTEPRFLERLQRQLGDFFPIPEGGANLDGIRGCQELLSSTDRAAYDRSAGHAGTADAKLCNLSAYSHILLACGTGTTMAGLITSTAIPVTGIQVLKGQGYLQQAIQNMLGEYSLDATAPWQVLDEFHRGGYARCDQALLDFTARFSQCTGVPIEPVYTGKLFIAMESLLASGYFANDANVLVVHGGGLQGARGWIEAQDR